jgi:hypothetical protein
MGLSTPGTDFVMPGHPWDALKKFRNRCYHAFKRPLPALVRSSSMHHRRESDQLVVLIVPNRRNYNGVLGRGMGAPVNATGYRFVHLDFTTSFADRIDVIRQTDIMVTGVGTGACNGFLLSDGAVVVVLGTMERSQTLSFQEEYLFAAMYWTRVVYPTYSQYLRMSPATAMELVDTARIMIRSDFDTAYTTSNGRLNLSPIGNAAADYFAVDVNAWGAIVGTYAPAKEFHMSCLNWPERMLCQKDVWSGNTCAILDTDALHKSRDKYGVCCSCV